MKNVLMVVLGTITTVVCWGLYGPLLNWGQEAMHHSRWRPLIVIGITYFVCTVGGASFLLWSHGDQGQWTISGIWWSIAGGVVAAAGAVAVLLAFNAGGRPIFIMPIVFGCAPIVTAVVTISWYRLWDKVNPLFYAGLVLVSIGAVMVLFFYPRKPKTNEPDAAPSESKAVAAASQEVTPDATTDSSDAPNEANQSNDT